MKSSQNLLKYAVVLRGNPEGGRTTCGVRVPEMLSWILEGLQKREYLCGQMISVCGGF